MATADRASRGIFLTVFAILFAVLALSNFTKFLQHLNAPERGGLVVLGHKITDPMGLLVGGAIAGSFLLIYVYGIWTMRRWVLPMSIAYAFYVPSNEVMFWSLHQLPPVSLGFIVVYLALSLTGSIGVPIYLAYHKERLR